MIMPALPDMTTIAVVNDIDSKANGCYLLRIFQC